MCRAIGGSKTKLGRQRDCGGGQSGLAALAVLSPYGLCCGKTTWKMGKTVPEVPATTMRKIDPTSNFYGPVSLLLIVSVLLKRQYVEGRCSGLLCVFIWGITEWAWESGIENLPSTLSCRKRIPNDFFTRKAVPPVSSGQFIRVESLILLLIFWEEILILFSLYEVSGQCSDHEWRALLQPGGVEGQPCSLKSVDPMA